MSKPREVIVVEERRVIFVQYVERKRRQRHFAAQFDPSMRTVEEVKQWVRDNPKLQFREEHKPPQPSRPSLSSRRSLHSSIGKLEEAFVDGDPALIDLAQEFIRLDKQDIEDETGEPVAMDDAGAGHEEGGPVWNAIHGIEEE